MLALTSVSGTTLWQYVQASYPEYRRVHGALTDRQRSLLAKVLQRNQQEWADGLQNRQRGRLTNILRFFLRYDIMTPVNFVWHLGSLARVVYLDQRLLLDQVPFQQRDLGEQIVKAVRLRTLCKAWRLLLLGDSSADEQPSGQAFHPHHMLYAELRADRLPTERQGESDFVQHFMEVTSCPQNITDPELTHRLAYTALVTLAAIYNNLRSFVACAHQVQPDWHLGFGQESYWTPEICHLSMTEASILNVLAQAVQQAPTNQTMLRIALIGMSLPESDVLAITQIYQGFQMAVPTILAKFRAFKYDSNVSKAGLPRRYPIRAHIDAAVDSSDVEALDRVASFSDSSSNSGDGVAVCKAYLRMHHPARALTHFDKLRRSSLHVEIVGTALLSYLFDRQAYNAYETAWQRTAAAGLQHNRDMWSQRLRLLLDNGQPLRAFAQFQSLVASASSNDEVERINPSCDTIVQLDIDIFHMMIRSLLLAKGIPEDIGVATAAQVLDMLRNHRGLGPSRETYMLLIRPILQRGDRQSAADWFAHGRSSDIEFSPSDIVLLFEYDLASRESKEQQSLADPASNVQASLRAVGRILRLTSRPRHVPRCINYSTADDFLRTAKEMPTTDHIEDNIFNTNKKNHQTIYTKTVHHLAQPFSQQSPGQAKQARLHLLLLLWDYCTIIVGIPPSTKMDQVLTTTILEHMHPDLQSKLLFGAMFNNYDRQDPLRFYSYRFLRRIGPRWFVDRLGSTVSDSVKAKLLDKLVWNGYPGLTEETLVSAGVGMDEGRRLILDTVEQWKQQAISNRLEGARRRKESRARRKMGNVTTGDFIWDGGRFGVRDSDQAGAEAERPAAGLGSYIA